LPKAPLCHAAWPIPNVAASGLPNLQSFDTTDAEVAIDRRTGLSWQRVLDSNVYDMRGGNAYCGALALDGRHDWRLPAMIELATILDTARGEPAADPVAFPGTPPTKLWSSQTDITNTGLGWFAVLKGGGIYSGDNVTRFARVRCVRGPSACIDGAGNPYTVGNDSVHDNPTGLTWRRTVEHDNYAWQAANGFCAKLEVGGGGWRLPSLRELLALVDVTRYDPAIDGVAFPNTPSEFFWSSSPSNPPSGMAWGVNFTRGASASAVVSTSAHVRCVR
jgi:hypothetical protein